MNHLLTKALNQNKLKFTSSSSSSVAVSVSALFRHHPNTNTNTNTNTTAYFSTATQPSVTLYQYAICPFCNINKALLDYVNLNYKHIEVNPLSKAELKPWSGSYTKVPIAKIDDEQINGSTEINIELLKSQFVTTQLEQKWKNHDDNNNNNKNNNNNNNNNNNSMDDDDNMDMNMEEFVSSEEAKKWSLFAKEELAPILYPNICRSLSESYQAFGYVKDVEHFTTMQKVMIRGIGSFAMYVAASKIKSKRNIKDERKALEDAITIWEKDGLDQGQKLYSSGSSQPNLGDVSMFGVMHSVSGLVAHDEVIRGRGGVVGEWYERMEKEVLG